MTLTTQLAERIAQQALDALAREFPHKPGHVASDVDDIARPSLLHPAFWGAFDWHSAVHTLWTLARVRRLFADEPWTQRAQACLSGRLTEAHLARETAFVRCHPAFERPYGLAWLLVLDGELAVDKPARVTAELAEVAASELVTWASRLPMPIRTGEHNQSAFALALTLDWLDTWASPTRAQRLRDIVAAQYAKVHPRPPALEPDAHDFLSPSLADADLLRRALGATCIDRWLRPVAEHDWQPVVASDMRDGKLVHHAGLNWSRAWMLRALGLAARAEAHERAGLDRLITPHFAGSHWLGSFAVFALAGRWTPPR